MKNIWCIFLLSILLFNACNTVPSAENLSTEIEEFNAEMKNTTSIDEENVKIIIDKYQVFIDNYPNNEKTPSYIEMQAKYYSLIGNFENALANYSKIYSEYENYEDRPEALFMQAFINEENLNNKEKAEELYTQFLEEFPNDEFADDAKFSLENLYMTPEQLLEKFKQQSEGKDSTLIE